MPLDWFMVEERNVRRASTSCAVVPTGYRTAHVCRPGGFAPAQEGPGTYAAHAAGPRTGDLAAISWLCIILRPGGCIEHPARTTLATCTRTTWLRVLCSACCIYSVFSWFFFHRLLAVCRLFWRSGPNVLYIFEIKSSPAARRGPNVLLTCTCVFLVT